SGGRLEFHVGVSLDQLRFQASLWPPSGTPRRISKSWALVDPDQVTKSAIRRYLAGVNRYLHRVNTIRDQFYHEHLYAMRIADPPCRDRFHVRSIPRPTFKGELPRTSEELAQYERWIWTIEGQDKICDGWSRPLVFTLANGSLACRSAGPDGRYGTQDDI